MTKTPTETLFAAVLKRVREAESVVYGAPRSHELKRGLMSDPCQCVIGRSLPAVFEGVDSRSVSCPVKEGGTAINLAAAWGTKCVNVLMPRDSGVQNWLEIGLPDDLAEFVTRFDAGEFPELVEAEA